MIKYVKKTRKLYEIMENKKVGRSNNFPEISWEMYCLAKIGGNSKF